MTLRTRFTRRLEEALRPQMRSLIVRELGDLPYELTFHGQAPGPCGKHSHLWSYVVKANDAWATEPGAVRYVWTNHRMKTVKRAATK